VALIGLSACAHHRTAARAVGFWEVTGGNEYPGFHWLAILPGDSADTVAVSWDTGLMCVTEVGSVVRDHIDVAIGGVPSRLEVHGSAATLLTPTQSLRPIELTKTRKSPSVLCE
jgi:hypothetical protein